MRPFHFLADHALAVLDEIVEEIENLRLDGDPIDSTPQFPPVNIERAICENVDHHADPAVQRSCPFPRKKTGKSQAKRYRKTVQPTNFGGVVLERSPREAPPSLAPVHALVNFRFDDAGACVGRILAGADGRPVAARLRVWAVERRARTSRVLDPHPGIRKSHRRGVAMPVRAPAADDCGSQG